MFAFLLSELTITTYFVTDCRHGAAAHRLWQRLWVWLLFVYMHYFNFLILYKAKHGVEFWHSICNVSIFKQKMRNGNIILGFLCLLCFIWYSVKLYPPEWYISTFRENVRTSFFTRNAVFFLFSSSIHPNGMFPGPFDFFWLNRYCPNGHLLLSK